MKNRFDDDLEMQAVMEIVRWEKWPEVCSQWVTRLEFLPEVREEYDHKICVAETETFV